MEKLQLDFKKALRTRDGQKAYVFADLRAFSPIVPADGFYFVGGYFFQGEFYECRWNEFGQSDRTNYLGWLVGYWEE